jgi:pimeloyl-ACP methyl ester carboxylesterase
VPGARLKANPNEPAERGLGVRPDDALFHHQRRHPAAERLPELHLPVLMVGGDLDNIVPVATMLEAYGRIPNCGLQIFHRVGHMVQQEVPLEFASLVQDFVANRARPAGASSGGAPPSA